MSHMNFLREFILGESWLARFDENVLLLAKNFIKARVVDELKIDQLDEENITIRALVKSTPPSRVEVNFWIENDRWEIDSSCSCAISHNCKHAAALLFSLIKNEIFDRLIEEKSVTHKKNIQLPNAQSLIKSAADQGAVLEVKPTFKLQIIREKILDRSAYVVAQYLGDKSPTEWVIARAFAVYNHYSIPLQAVVTDEYEIVTDQKGSPLLIRRDRVAENTAMHQLKEIALQSLDASPVLRFLQSVRKTKDQIINPWLPQLPPSQAASYWHQFRSTYVAKLVKAHWAISFADNVGYEVYESNPDDWIKYISEEAGHQGWFHLSVGFDVAGEHYDLMPILANLLEDRFLEETLDRPNNGYILAPLPNGAALKIPIGRVRSILKYLAVLIDPQFPNKTRIHALDVASLSAIEELGIESPPALVTLTEKIQHFSRIDTKPVPQGLQAKMRDYQIAGFHWMQFLAEHGLNGILADDMGLGKTMQTLAHILTEKESGRSSNLPCLVIAPTSVVPNWRNEVAKFAPSLKILVLNGADRAKYFRSIPLADLVITSYALVQRDIEKLQLQPFHIIALDEAQYIKNPQAKVAIACCKLNAKHRLCLSGTPVENHLGELWSQMHFLMPGFLGTKKIFTERFRTPIEKNGDIDRLEALKRRVEPLILRRTKDQVAKELPPKTILVHYIELTTEQKDLYETIRATMDKRVRQAIAARGIEQSQIIFLDALLKLRQICCHPLLLADDFREEASSSAKLDFLTELISNLIEEGRRILLFSQFTSMLSIIENHLKKEKISYLILTGTSKDRGSLVDQFQSGKIPLFLISLKAGGTGLNLTAADTVIHYDPWWNPAAEAQATDRAYRIGQDKPVFVHKLLCENTVEQRIHLLQQSKAQLADSILGNADKATKLDQVTLNQLLAPLE
jgi:superfamily II DNA or RNA helicase